MVMLKNMGRPGNDNFNTFQFKMILRLPSIQSGKITVVDKHYTIFIFL